MVYRLVTANTIDERIVERAAAKRRLEKLIIHRQKFKSQDLSGLKTTMQAVTAQELLDMLNSKDHAGIMDRKDGPIFSQEELDTLLDRSELTWAKAKGGAVPLKDKNNTVPAAAASAVVRSSPRSRNKQPAAAGSPVVRRNSSKTNNIFKVVDTEGIPNGLQSVREGGEN